MTQSSLAVLSPALLQNAQRKTSTTGTLIAMTIALWLTGCATAPPTRGPARGPDAPAPQPRAPEPAASPTLQKLVDEAAALQPLAQSALAKRFLDATHSLPVVTPRRAYVNEVTREYYSPAARNALPAAQQTKLAEVTFDESRYYYTKYGSPLAYVRSLDLAAANGIKDVAGRQILDFGYGSVGHLRLLASLGAHVTGIDPDSYLSAMYAQPSDQGRVPSAGGWFGAAGSVTLAHGFWPKDQKMIEKVGQGYDLILSKNTLKKGYIKPDRKIDKRQQIDLGVSDDVFLKTVFNALVPGGKLVIYNLYPKPPEGKNAYNPQADARSPYTPEQYKKAGFEVLAYNQEDHEAARSMGRALRWDKNDKGETISDLNTNLFAMVTIVGRPGR
jgi:SAM-dependent methyltransferase